MFNKQRIWFRVVIREIEDDRNRNDRSPCRGGGEAEYLFLLHEPSRDLCMMAMVIFVRCVTHCVPGENTQHPRAEWRSDATHDASSVNLVDPR